MTSLCIKNYKKKIKNWRKLNWVFYYISFISKILIFFLKNHFHLWHRTLWTTVHNSLRSTSFYTRTLYDFFLQLTWFLILKILGAVSLEFSGPTLPLNYILLDLDSTQSDNQTNGNVSVGAASKCYWDETMLLKCELVKSKINTKQIRKHCFRKLII